MKVENLTSSNGKKVPNQFRITDDHFVYFQSYESLIFKIDFRNHIVYIDGNYAFYSKTTSKYQKHFLTDNQLKEIKKHLKDKTDFTLDYTDFKFTSLNY